MDTKNIQISLSIICIDVDPAIISYVLSEPGSANFSLDICVNLYAARKKMSDTLYDVCIIGHSLLQEAAFSLIKEIRNKASDQSTIALIVDKHLAESHQLVLKEDKKMDFIIEKSNFKESIDQLFKDLRKRKDTQSGITVENKLQEIKRKYDETIQEKMAHLSTLVKAAQENPEFCRELNADIHKISGSAGCFGYAAVSEVCKKKETEINQRLREGTYKDKTWLASFDQFLEKVQQGFQVFAFEGSSLYLKQASIEKPILFVVDQDVGFLDLLERVKESFWVNLVVESDPAKAIELLHSSQFQPRGMIVSQNFASSSISGFDILKIPAEKKSTSQMISALILDEDSIDVRLEAMERGADYIFCKPVSAYLLLKNMTEAIKTKAESHIKVLLVDDDVDFSNYITTILEELGLTVHAINEGTDLFKKLEEFKPNILLLDLTLPKYDGMNLLKTLRQDVLYLNLIIVIVTGNEKFDIAHAYASDVDHVLFKPIDPIQLQKHILGITKRITHESIEDYTGLLQLPDLLDELSSCLNKSDRSESTLALFEVNEHTDKLPLKDLTIYISNQLQWEIDETMKCYIYKSSKFAIVFQGVRLENIQMKMFNFLTKLANGEKKWNLSFNCGIVPISKKFADVSNVLKGAEECLLEASKKDLSVVNIVQRVPKGETNTKKEVVIIDPNADLTKILRRSFESRGVAVNIFAEGMDALKHLQGSEEVPSLIIMERQLPDMDGMDLYHKLRARFRSKIPFFFLTVFSSDKDVYDSVKMGVQEYITKPFNISILMEKSLQVIFKE